MRKLFVGALVITLLFVCVGCSADVDSYLLPEVDAAAYEDAADTTPISEDDVTEEVRLQVSSSNMVCFTDSGEVIEMPAE